MPKKKQPSVYEDEDIGTIAVCAVRYALGRETYMPSLVQGFVKRHPEIVDEKTRTVMIRDINEADCISEYKLSSGETLKIDGLGSTTIDRPGWLDFRAWLQCLEVKKP